MMTEAERKREFWLRVRQALLILLGAVEELMLEMPRSVQPRHRVR